MILNNTLPEISAIRPDTTDEWSHNAVIPLFSLFMHIAGIRPLEPGFKRMEVRPQLCDLGALELTAYTPKGPVLFAAKLAGGGHDITVTLPSGSEGEVVLMNNPGSTFERVEAGCPPGLMRFKLSGGRESSFFCRHYATASPRIEPA